MRVRIADSEKGIVGADRGLDRTVQRWAICDPVYVANERARLALNLRNDAKMT